MKHQKIPEKRFLRINAKKGVENTSQEGFWEGSLERNWIGAINLTRRAPEGCGGSNKHTKRAWGAQGVDLSCLRQKLFRESMPTIIL